MVNLIRYQTDENTSYKYLVIACAESISDYELAQMLAISVAVYCPQSTYVEKADVRQIPMSPLPLSLNW